MNIRFIILLPLCLLFTACGGSSGSKIELKNATSPNSTRDLTRYALTDQTSNITIDSLKIPMFDVGLSYADELYGSSESGILYDCSGTTAEACEVELVGPALQNLLTGGENTGSLDSGKSYSSVMIATCPAGPTNYKAKLKAKATVAGTLYYTKTGSQYMTSTESEYGAVEITFNTCRNYTVLSPPIVYSGGVVTVSLYIDLRNIAHVFGTGSSLYGGTGNLQCSLSQGTVPSGSPYICLEYPNVGGTISTGTPTIERYKLANVGQSSMAPQLVGFFFDSDGQPIGGFNRAYITEVTSQTSTLTTPAAFKKTRFDGTNLFWTDYSGGTPDTSLGSGTNVTNQASTQGNFTVENFPRPALGASAQSITSVKDTNGTASTVNYSVTRID